MSNNPGADTQDIESSENSVYDVKSQDVDTSSTHVSDERDEVAEIRKLSAEDTRRVQIWRVGVMLIHFFTACAVTFTTYRFLKKEETNNFETAFEQFARAVGDASITQQEDLRDALRAFATSISVSVANSDMEWPFVTIPGYESIASEFLSQAKMEVASMFPKVTEAQREEYLAYANSHSMDWVYESHMIQKGSLERLVDPGRNFSYHDFISAPTPEGLVPDMVRDEYWPSWQFTPPPSSFGLINWNAVTIPEYEAIMPALRSLKNETLVTRVRQYTVGVPTAMSKEEHDALHSRLTDSRAENPHSFVWQPIHLDANDIDSEIVAIIGGATAWDVALLNLLPENVRGIHAVLDNNCEQSYTYIIKGKDALFLGDGDMHLEKYDEMEVLVDLALHTHPDFQLTPGHCQYSMHIYPTDEFQKSYDANTPEIFAAIVASTFVVVALVFLIYDIMVQRRNNNLIAKAAQSNAIVSSLFPEHMRNRLMDEKGKAQEKRQAMKKGNLKSFFLNDGTSGALESSGPMADLFLESTVLFADISGFTAWSSVREPNQVFMLLETLYQAFDKIAKRRGVFKIETVGDCYVAVTGVPEPRKDHAVVMARFAKDILGKMHSKTKELELSLGPDTGDLALRIGMHSGPVTAGVLRGERARFQLFGDTMNTCSRLESTGLRNHIQCSKETAHLLREAGKSGWLHERADTIDVKGKGRLNTYFVKVAGERANSVPSVSSGDMHTTYKVYDTNISGLDEKTCRLIDWNVEMLLRLMKQIVAQRSSMPRGKTVRQLSNDKDNLTSGAETPLEEVREIITLPAFNGVASHKLISPDDVDVPRVVLEELHLLVSKIASMYNDNPFHNFEHASHVVMSVIKLMSRIVAPSHMDDAEAASLHDHSFGITSDPLTQFACAFSALIHDVDHTGVSNAQLVKEHVPMATKYKERSVAEQNSLDLSWALLMQPEFKKFRAFLFPDPCSLTRFRQLVVNAVMSTDIVDKDLKTLRNLRWDKAFKLGVNANYVDENPRDEVNRKATIVIEHIIQASDIAHTMQHWKVYRKWNQNLYEELYVAYLNGRLDQEPADFWYKGELGFFDFYIIPLLKKLKECGVFGISSDEYLNYALKNREEWEARGEDVVTEMITKTRATYGVKMDMVPEEPVTKFE